MPARTRIALIVDNLRLARWQADALRQIADDAEFIVVNCGNTQLPRKPFRHALYYFLNILSLKTPATASVPLPTTLRIVDRVDFQAELEGAWQRLPPTVLQLLKTHCPQVAIKFGMGLLRVPDELECKILSYHHGDPRHFRGRPAGFYELLHNVSTVGQIVQIISNRLDAGAVVAFAETRAQPHSYRATMAQAYRISPLLLKTAIRNCLSGHILPMDSGGKNYRLPSNWTVLRFAAKLVMEKLSRLAYGAFFEKSWEVASADIEADSFQLIAKQIDDRSRWKVIPRPGNYQFLADPFPHPCGGILAEALRRNDGQGEIVHIAPGSSRILCAGSGHFSYPATVNTGESWFVLPEVSEWRSPVLYRLTDCNCEVAGDLDVAGMPRLIDATLYTSADGIFLFANDASEGSEVLRLWTAASLFSRFDEHPRSPVRISPVGGRMAGAILELAGRCYRLGQDCSQSYGRRIVAFEIIALSHSAYEEIEVDELSFTGANGPHTFNIRDGEAIFDLYEERFSFLAGVRRLKAAYAKRQANASSRNNVNA